MMLPRRTNVVNSPIIYSVIANIFRKVINHSLEINEIIYWYWWISQVLGINIHWLKSLIESDG